jgi:hypothetical protein
MFSRQVCLGLHIKSCSVYDCLLRQYDYRYVPTLWHMHKLLAHFFSGEGPSSRRYGRTAALRLLVQPCDEDEDDYYFCPFPSN